VFAWYLLIYGSGRFVIEQLRMDSLYIGDFRASQYLSLILCAAVALLLVWRACRRNGRPYALHAACCLLWVLRWLFVERHAVYAVLFLCAGAAALWLARNQKTALAGVLRVILLDGVGLLAAVMQWPFSLQIAIWLHALICSITLPAGVLALCAENQ